MTRASIFLLLAFTCGFIVALTSVSGCSYGESRTLCIVQDQSTKTYSGAFRIDTSDLPADAIMSQTQTNKAGGSDTQLVLNRDYEIEVVLRPMALRQSKKSLRLADE